MRFIDSLTYALTYGLLTLAVFVFVSCLVVGGLCFLVPWTYGRMAVERRPKLGMKAGITLAFLMIASAYFIIFLVRSMFFQFCTFSVESNKINLKFFWPRPAIAISRSQFQNFELETDRKGNAQLILILDGRKYASVPFDRFIDTNVIQSQLAPWATNANK